MLGLTTITLVALTYKFIRIWQEVKTIPPEERTVGELIKRLIFAL